MKDRKRSRILRQSRAMKKHWAKKRAMEQFGREGEAVPEKAEGISYNTTTNKQLTETDARIYEARQNGRKEAYQESLDGMLAHRDELTLELRQINLRIAHRLVDIGLE